jgi:fused signal recognition particle receptor
MFLFGKRKKKTSHQDSKDQDDLLNNEANDNAQDLTESSQTPQNNEKTGADELTTEQDQKSTDHSKQTAESKQNKLDKHQNDQNEQPPEAISVTTEATLQPHTIVTPTTDDNKQENPEPAEKPKAKRGLFSRLKQGLSKTGSAITEGMGALVLGKKKIDDDLLEELETRLLMADVGIEATQEIMDDLTKRVSRKQLDDVDSLMKAMEEKMTAMLSEAAQPLTIDKQHQPTVLLMVGINGAGKTTTIGKLAKKFQAEGKSVMLAAGDTFRAAAVEQLQTWGERNNVPVIAQNTGSDTASVIYDAVASAKARKIDLLLADTAGRLHTQSNLMDELKKVKRVIQKLDKSAPHEIMLIVDASIGQNALIQAKEFHQALGLTGITVTKLDGTAKGGILFAIAQQLDVAIRYIGVGEGIDDLQVFDAQKFTQALLNSDNTEANA